MSSSTPSANSPISPYAICRRAQRYRTRISVRVLKSLADAFNISAETMLERAGLLDETRADGERAADTEAAIKADTRLSAAQKEALLAVYRGFSEAGT